jgi:dipeptidyl aminopeptidase/acylaminoacyl peptidase
MPGHDGHDVVNDVVLLRAEVPSEPIVVSIDSDFVMAPRFVAPDRLRFVAWNHPAMPWDTTCVAEAALDLAAGTVIATRVLADGASYMHPLAGYVISDRSGWWNLWRLSESSEEHVHPVDAEVGAPAWIFGDRPYVELDDGRLVYSAGSVLYVDGLGHAIEPAGLDQFTADGTFVTAIARYTDRNPAVVRFDADRPAEFTIIVPSRPLDLAGDDIATPTEIRYATPAGIDAYAWFYPPTNAAYEGPVDLRPPLVTMIHGGPTSDAVPFFSLARQFWTSRGFAVVDVNHRGSTGYGTEFRNLLEHQWGVVDVEDCCAAAAWLAAAGTVDGDRMVIRGGSAGGFTVLSCLARSDVFAAGASMYGVADLMALATDTHKFEARYLDHMIGPLPEAQPIYERRSPINQLDRFHRPLIVFQGADDEVVPPSQSESIVAALRDKGIECDYHLYAGEGHGFRRADTIVHQLTSELDFYQRILALG